MNRQRVVLSVFGVVLITMGLIVQAQAKERTSSNDPALKRWLERYPASDADGDGILTETEAKAFRKKMKSKARKADAGQDTKSTAAPIEPTYSDVAYGPHERNKLDLWQAESKQPAPVLIYFHGGSFKAGDKSSVLKRPVFEDCLKAGISVVSANYRFSTDAPFPAPMLDGARVVQFVRHKAREWNINPSTVSISGGSAGGTMALWIALHDDMADPASEDPVLRESTRVSCLVGYGAPASMAPEYILKHAGSKNIGGAIAQLFGVKTSGELARPEIRELLYQASPINHITKEDPPVWLVYRGTMQEAPLDENAPQNVWIHHVCLGMPLKKKCDDLGVECHIYDQATAPGKNSEIGFLKRLLKRHDQSRN